VRHVREARGVPLWLVRDYLVEMGGRADGDTVEGDGWTARLGQLDDFEVGSLKVGQIRIELEADEETMARLREELERKLLRAGG